MCNRCENDALSQKFTELMQLYNSRAEEHGSGFKDNPSPGNIKDGLITDAIKSAGAAKKGGTSPIVDVLDYPDSSKEVFHSFVHQEVMLNRPQPWLDQVQI